MTKNKITEVMYDLGIMAMSSFLFYETHHWGALLLLLLMFSSKEGHYGSE